MDVGMKRPRFFSTVETQSYLIGRQPRNLARQPEPQNAVSFSHACFLVFPEKMTAFYGGTFLSALWKAKQSLYDNFI